MSRGALGVADLEQPDLAEVDVRKGMGDEGVEPLLVDLHVEDLASALREEAARGDASGETMLRIADLLESNVRREERELFPLIEQTVPDTELHAADLPSSVTAATDA